MGLKIFVSVVLLSGFLFMGNGFTQEQDSVWGTVIEISDTNIVINEYDFESETEKEMAYKLGPDIQLENIPSIDQIQKGDMVDITLSGIDGEEVVTVISVEKSSELSEEDY